MPRIILFSLILSLTGFRAVAGEKQAHMVKTMIEETNNFRRREGRRPLKVNAELTEAAQKHAAHMARKENMSHDGFSFFIKSSGYSYTRLAENVASFSGSFSAVDVVHGWMKSSGHRRNLLDRRLVDFGIGMAQGKSHRWYICQDFGCPR